VLSIKHPSYFWLFYPLSLLLAAAHIFMMEYFVGLEVLRPFILLLSLKLFGSKEIKLWRRAILIYLPYLIILLGYLYWRFKIFPEMYQVTAGFSNNPFLLRHLLSAPLNTLEDLINTVVQDVRFSFLSSWLDRLWPVDFQIESKMMWVFAAGGSLGQRIVFYCSLVKNQRVKPGSRKMNSGKILALAQSIFLFGVAPVWVTLRQISVGKYSERFALAAIPGIALIFAAVIWKVVRSAPKRGILLSILVLLSISYQIQMGSDMKKDFDSQQNFLLPAQMACS